MSTNDAGRTKTTENNWIFNKVKPSSVQSNELLRLSFAFSFTYVAKLNRTVNIDPNAITTAIVPIMFGIWQSQGLSLPCSMSYA